MPARLITAIALVVGACSASTTTPIESTQVEAPADLTTTTRFVETTTTSSTTLPATTTTTTLVAPDGLEAADRRMTLVATISGDISPKSVVANGHGLFFAQNMMYRHTITVYDRDYELVETIDDNVIPSAFGHFDYEGEYQGSPVEAAFTSDGRYAYVSNYRMYGGGLSTAASDGCNRGDWPDSFVYRVETEYLEIDQLIRVGSVPKFLAVTPDDGMLLVSNWCGFDVSIVDLSTGTEITRVDIGRHPRGIAISPDSQKAFVAVMGSSHIAVIDLSDFSVSTIDNVGRSPRHLVISPDGSLLYVSLNGEGRIAQLDTATGEILAKVATGAAPRSMTISDDGSALYVVNYNSGTVSKVRTADMVEVEEHPTGVHPIGITYDAATRQIWVANYSGTIQIFADAGE